jgi:DNA modification methylase
MATKDYINKISQGDCLELLAELDDNSVDSIITDPPYGLSNHSRKEVNECLRCWLDGKPYKPKGEGFMGKAWDAWVPDPDVWRECLRVLKPGGTALVFAGTRSMDLMSMSLRLSGFELRDSINYMHESGGAPYLSYMYGSGFPKSLNVGKSLDKMQGNEREIIGSEQVDIGIQSGSMHAGRESNVITRDLTKGSSPFEGYGTALKPSFEPIILAMKPNDGSYAENALKWGVAGLNIDGCRIGTENIKCGNAFIGNNEGRYNFNNGTIKEWVGNTSTGRFPANTILGCACEGDTHSPNCPVAILDEQSGVSKAGNAIRSKSGGKTFGGDNIKPLMEDMSYNDTGTASRFLYTAKASKSERNEGCEELGNNLKEGVIQEYGSIRENRGAGYEKASVGRNTHPTIKPLLLMEYLCKLTRTPTGGIVLDPFAGSGTTLIAAHRTKRDFIGFELDSDYVKIANARLAYWRKPEREREKITNRQKIIEKNAEPTQMKLV